MEAPEMVVSTSSVAGLWTGKLVEGSRDEVG